METDLLGRVRNTSLPASHALMPVFEAVINSIFAIEDATEPNGYIRIAIERNPLQLATEPRGNLKADVQSYTIEDNGIGFTEENLRAFLTLDSLAKATRGAKGVGRLFWLKAFDHAVITSTYPENEAWYDRTFEFRATSQGLEGLTTNEITQPTDGLRKTTVRLVGYKPPYIEKSPRGDRKSVV